MLTEKDIDESIEAKSDQLNAVDFISGPAVVTVESVEKGNSKQPWQLRMVEFPRRPYRPSKSMRRAIVAAWGKQTAEWPGRRMVLFYDPNVPYAGQKVGGIKIAAISHISAPFTIPLLEAGKRLVHPVEPLAADATPVAPSISDQQITDATSVDELRELYDYGTPEQQAWIMQRANEMNNGG